VGDLHQSKATFQVFFIFVAHFRKQAFFVCSKNKKPRSSRGCFYFGAGSNLPSSNQITNENPEELQEAQIQRFLGDLRAISHFCKAFRVGQK